MSLLPRILPQLPATRRAYSSFFSSKPGGGRYFNSAKPSKSAVVASGKAKANHTKNDDVVNGNNGHGNGVSKMKSGGVEEPSRAQPASTTVPSNDSASEAEPSSSDTSSTFSSSTPFGKQFTIPSHPVMTPQEYKLHQFFSLHRPLLLHALPTSAIFETPSQSLWAQPSTSGDGILPAPTNLGTFDNPPEASPDADADAARQLARALVMNRVGASISWENTLSKLGVTGEDAEGKAALAKEWARDWETIHADSTKRKRKKKMKKHK